MTKEEFRANPLLALISPLFSAMAWVAERTCSRRERASWPVAEDEPLDRDFVEKRTK